MWYIVVVILFMLFAIGGGLFLQKMHRFYPVPNKETRDFDDVRQAMSERAVTQMSQLLNQYQDAVPSLVEGGKVKLTGEHGSLTISLKAKDRNNLEAVHALNDAVTKLGSVVQIETVSKRSR